MPMIEDFIDQSTGALASVARGRQALLSGSYGGFTPVDADGQPVPANTPLSPHLQQVKGQLMAAGTNTNWMLLAVAAVLVWYFFLRRK